MVYSTGKESGPSRSSLGVSGFGVLVPRLKDS